MPIATNSPPKGVKRKRDRIEPTDANFKHSSDKSQSRSSQSTQNLIDALEDSILESRKNYNKILELLQLVESETISTESNVRAAVASHRVFCKLLAIGEIGKTKSKSGDDLTISDWLTAKLNKFKSLLLDMLYFPSKAKQATALNLSMLLVRDNAALNGKALDSKPAFEDFARIVDSLLSHSNAETARQTFINQFLSRYQDVQQATLLYIGNRTVVEDDTVPATMSILLAIKSSDQQDEEEVTTFVNHAKSASIRRPSPHSEKTKAQKAWSKLLSAKLGKSQRKTLLEVMTTEIAPWFIKMELLMDFLTDSFNLGGSTALLALSGIFYLIKEKNLDYPSFYTKLYSMLDADILHSKHRSNFLRLLDTFLASTHLPATLVASFVKRVSRLCLHSPPAAIVAIVPWVYNVMKAHPSCTFMLHRNADTDLSNGHSWGDPFRADEVDPTATNAVESSLWELQSLQSHYHPNVAAVAKILAEQFTKHSYTIDDFLDHSYATMTEAELAKSLKKAPVVEYVIPKRILTKAETGDGTEDTMLASLWNFS